jgi:plastocyanin
MGYIMNRLFIIFIVFLIFFIAEINITYITFEIVKAQNNDDYKTEQIRHMPGHGPRHMMMERMYLENDTETQSTMLAKNTNLDYQNSFNISIVFGAISRTIDAYQPNPAYIESGQTIIWTNNDNFIHTVTQKPFPDDSETFPSKFDSGIFNKGQSFVHSFNEEGRYDYYCTIHPWMVGQVFVTPNFDSSMKSDTKNSSSVSIME